MGVRLAGMAPFQTGMTGFQVWEASASERVYGSKQESFNELGLQHLTENAERVASDNLG